MNTILVIAPQSNLADAVRASLDPSFYRVLGHSELNDDELRLSAGSIDACICEVDLTIGQADPVPGAPPPHSPASVP